MPSISKFEGITIYIYPNEHGKPHFHARYQAEWCKISISKLEVEAGYLPPKQLRKVRVWATRHKEEILSAWEKSQNNKTTGKISPTPYRD